MTSPAEQSAMYARLQEVLGPEPAATLMTMLPSGDHLATRADIADVRSELAEVKTELKADIAAVRSELAEVKTELKADIAAVRSELKADIADLKSELKEELREMRVMIRGYDEALRGYVRTFVVAQVATVVGVTGIVLGIERLA